MSDEWPPEWEDPEEESPEEESPEEESPEEADQLDTEAEARLSEVTAYLASVPAPVLPDAVEARISAALANEAAARTGGWSSSSAAASSGTASGAASSAGSSGGGSSASSGAVGPTDGARTLGPTRSRVGRRRSGGGAGRPVARKRSLVAVASVAACLILAGFGYGLSRVGSSSSSSANLGIAAGSSSVEPNYGAEAGPAKAAPAPSAAAGRPSTAAARPSATAAASAASSASAPAAAGTSAASPYDGGNVSFVVIASGTSYEPATLTVQVRARLTAPAMAGTAPSAALRGCVSGLTDGRSPRLVDRATYQGSAAYIIASSSQVWVVGLGCTAANPELITSVPLGG